MLDTCLTRCCVWQVPIWQKLAMGLVAMVIIGAVLFATSMLGGDYRVKSAVQTDGPCAVAGGSGTCTTDVGSPATGCTAVLGTAGQETAAATIHHCECDLGWCVAPLQLAHPRHAEPSN